MPKTFFTLTFALMLISSSAFAGIIATWDFDGNTPAFSSDYTEWWQAGQPTPSGNMNEGKYAIVNDSTTVHQAFQPAFHGHTTGSDNFMLVNGYDGVGGQDVPFFVTDLTGLIAGRTYEFYFFAANAYGGKIPYDMPINPAELGVKLVGSNSYISTFQLPTTVGIWHEYGISFVAPEAGGRLGVYDLNRAAWGNDFGFDDPTLHAPEPSAWMFGVGGLAAMILLRRRRRP